MSDSEDVGVAGLETRHAVFMRRENGGGQR